MGIRPTPTATNNKKEFESLVNSDGYQTETSEYGAGMWFESLVNSDGYQTATSQKGEANGFESLVNSDGYQTDIDVRRSDD